MERFYIILELLGQEEILIIRDKNFDVKKFETDSEAEIFAKEYMDSNYRIVEIII